MKENRTEIVNIFILSICSGSGVGHAMTPGELESGTGEHHPHLDIRKPGMVAQMFRDVFAIETNQWLFIQALPGCIGWSVVGVFLNDYLHIEGGLAVEGATKLTLVFGMSALFFALVGGVVGQFLYNINPRYLTFLISFTTLCAIPPFILLFHTQQPYLGQGHHPSAWAMFLMAIAGVAAVAPPHIKGILQNANESCRRGTVFSCLTLFDDLGKGFGPSFVYFFIAWFGRRVAFSIAFCLWTICAFCTFKIKNCLNADVLKAGNDPKSPRHSQKQRMQMMPLE